MNKEEVINYINDKGITSYNFSQVMGDYINDIDVVLVAVKANPSIFSSLQEQFRNNPIVLKTAIESVNSLWGNPMRHALPSALTNENIFLAIDKNLVFSDDLTPDMLSNKEVVIYFMEKKDTSIYRNLSEEFRNDPEILKIAISNVRNSWSSPMRYALPSALTNENIFLAIDKNLVFRDDLTPDMLSNKEVVMYFMEKKDTSIYRKLSDEFRSDPEILKVAISNSRDSWSSPMRHALPSALTNENIFLAIDKNLVFKDDLTPDMLSNKEVVIYFMEKKDTSIYRNLSEEFRSDPEILKAAIMNTRELWSNPVKYALPNALTKENIDLIAAHNLYEESTFLLDNQYYVLIALSQEKIKIDKVSERLKNDPVIISMVLVFNPSLFESFSKDFLTEAMKKYATDNQLEINEENISNIILSDDSFVKKILPLCPRIYPKLPDETKAKPENIHTVLAANGRNLVYIPMECINDELVEFAINNGYQLSFKHFEIIDTFFNKKIKEDPSKILDLFINIDDKGCQLLLLQAIAKSNIDRPIEVDKKINFILNKYVEKYKKMGIEEKYIVNFINNVLSGETSALNLLQVDNFHDLLYATNLGNLFADEKSKKNNPMRLRPMLLNRISFDIFTKTNTKQYKEIKQILLDMGIDDYNASEIGLKAYSVLGFARAKEIMNGKYGPVDIDKLTHLFKDLNCSEVIFEPDGNKNKPMINDQLINLLFGASYKVNNTPIRNYLNGFSEMEAYTNKEIEKINSNQDLTQEDKDERIAKLNASLSEYSSTVRTFIENINFIFNNWDIIEEEFLKKQSVSKLKLKLNISQINEIVQNIKEVKKSIVSKTGFSEKQQSRFKRIPGYESRDYPLVQSDVFDFVGIQTQFTTNPEQAPARAVALSRMMENKSTKKIPNVNLDYGQYSIKIFNPQDRNLISAGYRSGCCFRPNGNADNSGKNNSLLTYCCTTEYGSGIEIRDSKGKTLMFSPILRNGNVLMIHSFETIGLTEYEKNVANELLYAWAEEVIKTSQQEENEQGIVAVAMTDLHSSFDTTKSKAVLPPNKQFKVYNPDYSFDGMYNNLAGNNHHILAFAENKNIQDIMYDQEVEKSYQYPSQIWDVKTVAVSNEQLEMINQIRTNKTEIILLANKRRELLKARQEELAFESLKRLSEIRKANLVLQRNLYLMSENSKRDVLSDYIEGVEMANQVCDELGISRKAEQKHFIQIFYSAGWYLGITDEEKLYGDCVKGFEPQFFSALTDIKKNYGLELEYDINNDLIVPKTGGVKK